MNGERNSTAVAELLAEIEQLRRTLNAELDAAAGALDADEAGVAAAIIAATASLPMLGHGGLKPTLRSVKTTGS